MMYARPLFLLGLAYLQLGSAYPGAATGKTLKAAQTNDDAGVATDPTLFPGMASFLTGEIAKIKKAYKCGSDDGPTVSSLEVKTGKSIIEGSTTEHFIDVTINGNTVVEVALEDGGSGSYDVISANPLSAVFPQCIIDRLESGDYTSDPALEASQVKKSQGIGEGEITLDDTTTTEAATGVATEALIDPNTIKVAHEYLPGWEPGHNHTEEPFEFALGESEFEEVGGIPHTNHLETMGLHALQSLPSSYNPFSSNNCLETADMRGQGQCGSCYAFTASNAFSLRQCIKAAKAGHSFADFPWLATQGMVSCGSRKSPSDVKNQDGTQKYTRTGTYSNTGEPYHKMANGMHFGLNSKYSSGCQGGNGVKQSMYIADWGLTWEACSPYLSGGGSHENHWNNNNGKTPACPTTCAAAYKTANAGAPDLPKYYGALSTVKKIDVYGRASGIRELKAELQANGPTYCSITVYADFQQYRRTSRVYTPTGGSAKGGHAIVIYGWGREGGKNYWLGMNSWSNWGYGDKSLFKFDMDVAGSLGLKYCTMVSPDSTMSSTHGGGGGAAPSTPAPSTPSTPSTPSSCVDGAKNASPRFRSSQGTLSCPQLKGFCNHATHGAAITAKCKKSCGACGGTSHSHSPHNHNPHSHSPHRHSPHSHSPHSHSPHRHSPHSHSPHSHSPSNSCSSLRDTGYNYNTCKAYKSKYCSSSWFEMKCRRTCAGNCPMDQYTNCASLASRGYCRNGRFRSGATVKEKCAMSCAQNAAEVQADEVHQDMVVPDPPAEEAEEVAVPP